MPNLTAARRRVQKLMLDTCVITSAPLRLSDAMIDQTTLQLTPNSDDEEEVYSGAIFVAMKGTRSDSTETGNQHQLSEYFFGIPWDAQLSQNLQKGFVVNILASQDLNLVGRRSTISKIDLGTLQVWHSGVMELLESDRDV